MSGQAFTIHGAARSASPARSPPTRLGIRRQRRHGNKRIGNARANQYLSVAIFTCY